MNPAQYGLPIGHEEVRHEICWRKVADAAEWVQPAVYSQTLL